MRVVRAICVKVCLLAVLGPRLAHADSSGKIFLRGIVPQMAAISLTGPIAESRGAVIPGAPNRMALDLSSAGNGAGVAVFHLDRLANSNSGFVVRLEADSATSAGPMLMAADGAAIPYRVRFAGRDIDLGNGDAELATVTRQTEDDEAEGRFEIITPPIPGTGNGYTDHIILVVAAR